jgi:hypothetical protein
MFYFTAARFITFILAVLLLMTITGCGGGGGSSNSSDDNTSQNTQFDYPPLDLSKVEFILPLGGMIGNHVTPIDHQYYVAPDFGQAENIIIDVISPADGVVTSIQHMGSFGDDYRFVIQHTSAISSVYIHVDNLSSKLAAQAPGNGQYVSTNIDVSAGEVVGNYSGSVDYNIVDENITLTGFVLADSYSAEPWKTHIPDPFDYFNDSIKATLHAKCLRTATPVGGKIDHDIEGYLVGNWFLENTNGYAGLDPANYWLGHLAFAYDYIVPTHIIASFGDYAGSQIQFGILGNTPDPAAVNEASGLVKYDLVDYEYYEGGLPWDRRTHTQDLSMDNYTFINAVVLVQMVGPRRLKLEIFHGQTSSDVADFTSNALFYVR